MGTEQRHNKKIINIFFLLILSASLFLQYGYTMLPEEGMYPLNELKKLELNKAGLKIDMSEIYNPAKPGLIDAVVKTGGCTGSFISKDGLIITNHHCVFGLVQKVSTVENNYIENGFLAKNKSEEISITGQTCQITESYEDVSSQVLSAVPDTLSIAERIKAVQKKIKEIVAAEEAKNEGMKIDVSEMFTGRVYILFRYKIIKDIRLVYVPPRTIGEFGGETDNWVWPKHTGDFSFIRAYVAPDGSSREYSESNIPYMPKKFLKINPKGIEEGDFLFILGYPGRTFRNQTSQFVEFHEKVQLPYIASLYRYLINSYEELGNNKPEVALALAAKIKSLANVQKNYEGKLKGLDKLNIAGMKKEEENELKKFIASDKALNEKYGSLFAETEKIYEDIFNEGRKGLVLTQLINNVSALKLADILLNYSAEMSKPENERKGNYTAKNLHIIFEQIQNIFKEYNKDADKIALKKILSDAVEFSELKNFELFKRFNNSKTEAEKFAGELIDGTIFSDYKSFTALLEKQEPEINALNNAAINFASEIRGYNKSAENRNKIREGKLNNCMAQLYDVKKLWKQANALPDANSTLRLTYGYVRGYSPADATYYSPITSLRGVIEKSYLGDDFKIPAKLKELYNKKDFGKYKSKKLDDVPVALLYDTDTSGGNSGSPVMNALGELIGVNFDRTYEATINDYAWNENYSRSIGVDIRYVLWVTEKIGGAGYLLKEMGVE